MSNNQDKNELIAVDLLLVLVPTAKIPITAYFNEAIEIAKKYYGCPPLGELRYKRRKHLITEGFDPVILENAPSLPELTIPGTEFMFYLHRNSPETSNVGLVCDLGKWNSLVSRDLLVRLGYLHPPIYGAYIPNVLSSGEWNSLKSFECWRGLDSKVQDIDLDVYMLRAYTSLRFDYIWKHSQLGTNTSIYRCPMFFYIHNVLNSDQIRYRLGNSPTLADWINCGTRRGSLQQFSDNNYIWSIPPMDMENVYREIWESGILIAAEHFEIVGWRDDLLAPKLAAKPSIFDVASPWHCYKGRFLVEDVPDEIRDARAREKIQ